MYVGDKSYGPVSSCGTTCEAAQNAWESVRQDLIKAVKEKSTDLN